MDIRKFWAKTGKEGGYHPLICHSIDVGNVVQAIWQNVFTEKYRKKLADRLGFGVDEAGRWLAFWASLHDLGKLSPAFQRKNDAKKKELESDSFVFNTSLDVPHNYITAKVLGEMLAEGIASDGIKMKKQSKLFARIPGGHHGTFPTSYDLGGIHNNVVGDGHWQSAREEVIATLSHLFNPPQDLLPINGLGSGEAVFIAGLMVVADWIASNEDYQFFKGFPYSRGDFDIDGYFNTSKDNALKALEESRWSLTYELEKPPKSFKDLFANKTPRDLQQEVISIFAEDELPDFLLLEWPTGEGKTESAFWATAHWLMSEGQKGIYVALPTRATSDQMWQRTGDFLKVLFPEIDVEIALVHGLSQLAQAEQYKANMPDYEQEDGGSIYHQQDVESWFSDKKRALLQPFGVGTIDQALFSVLQVRHFFLRLFGLAGKTVILDEVHAYDTYTTDLMLRLIEWLSALGSRVVLLSATLPSNKRQELIEAYTGEEVDLGEFKYPATIAIYGSQAKVMHQPASNPHTLNIEWFEGPKPELVDLLSGELTEKGCAAVIMNTVRRAQETYEDLKENLPRDIDIHLLHSRFPYEDRQKIEGKLLNMYGPPEKANRPTKSVLVATQVIEQSMDLDFDVMISDLAPIDLLLQRAGRLHRHDRGERQHDRKLWIIEPEVVDGVPRDKQKESMYKYVYEEYIILKTWGELRRRKSIVIPDDVSELIDAVYGEEIDAQGALGEAIEEAREKFEEKIEDDEYDAACVTIKHTDDLFDLLDDYTRIYLREEDPTAHENLKAATRKSGPTVQLICLRAEEPLEMELYKEIEVFGEHPEKIPREKVNSLLLRSCSFSFMPFVGKIVEKYSFERNPFCRTPTLRYYVPLLFKEGMNCDYEGFTIKLNSEFGLSVEKDN